MWDDDLWGTPPSNPEPPPGREVSPPDEWSPQARPPGPQTARGKATVLVVAIALLVGTVILCCAALNQLAGLYFMDLDPIYLL